MKNLKSVHFINFFNHNKINKFMYNYHKYIEDQKLHNDQITKVNSKIKQAIKRNQIKDQLAENYHKRLEKFIQQATQNPIIYNKHQSKTDQLVYRQHQSHKILKDPQIYIKGFKTQRERINHEVQQHKFLDLTPIKSISSHEFRSRDAAKQIQKQMKYTPATAVQRVEDMIKNTITSQVFNQKLEVNKKKIAEKTKNFSSYQKVSYLSREISKNLLPTLHNKTHFKGLQQLYNKIPFSHSLSVQKKSTGLKNIDIANQMNDGNPQFQSPKSQVQTELDSTKKNIKKIDPVEASKKVLLNCKVISSKNQYAKILHKGEGKLFIQK